MVVIASVVGGADVALAIIRYATDLLGPQADGLLYDALTDTTAGAKVTLVGLPVLAWGALRTFRSLDTAFEEVYAAEDRDSLPEALLDAAVVFYPMYYLFPNVAPDPMEVSRGRCSPPARGRGSRDCSSWSPCPSAGSRPPGRSVPSCWR